MQHRKPTIKNNAKKNKKMNKKQKKTKKNTFIMFNNFSWFF